MIDFAHMVRDHRKQARLTQIELARLAGVGKSTVYDIENGKRTIQLDKLESVLTVLNIALQTESPLKPAHESSPNLSA